MKPDSKELYAFAAIIASGAAVMAFVVQWADYHNSLGQVLAAVMWGGLMFMMIFSAIIGWYGLFYIRHIEVCRSTRQPRRQARWKLKEELNQD